MKCLRSAKLTLAVLVLATGSTSAAGEISECIRTPGGTVVVPILGEQLGFHPKCVVIDSGATVVWRNDDIEAHDAGSADPGMGQCFRGQGDLGMSQPPLSSYAVAFEYDGLTAVSRYNGEAPRPCAQALDPVLTNAQQAAIRYKCYEHGIMTGTIIVERAP